MFHIENLNDFGVFSKYEDLDESNNQSLMYSERFKINYKNITPKKPQFISALNIEEKVTKLRKTDKNL